jgi:hypothetical protein
LGAAPLCSAALRCSARLAARRLSKTRLGISVADARRGHRVPMGHGSAIMGVSRRCRARRVTSRRRSREVCYVFETSHRPTGRLSTHRSPDARVCSLSTASPPHLTSAQWLSPSTLCRLWSDKCAAWGWVRRESRQVKSSPAPQTGCSSRPRAPLHHGAVMGAPHAPNGTLTARVPPSTMKVPTSLPDASISSFRCETKTVWPAARARTCSASARTF